MTGNEFKVESGEVGDGAVAGVQWNGDPFARSGTAGTRTSSQRFEVPIPAESVSPAKVPVTNLPQQRETESRNGCNGSPDA
ncbi:MAG: hypothetical protein BRD46_01050 [Bacteroidetes bacterium QS_8_68_15]|nr:MAG: hypothetical protein BRD46_01050 [Bacteroidetes bacterium QS_8_68_15]